MYMLEQSFDFFLYFFFQTNPQLFVTVTALGSNNLMAQRTSKVIIVDANDNAPEFSADTFSFTVSEVRNSQVR